MSDDRWPDRDGRNREDDRSGREREDPRERVRERESRDERSRPEPSLDRLDDGREIVRYRNHDYRLNDADVELLRTVGTFRAVYAEHLRDEHPSLDYQVRQLREQDLLTVERIQTPETHRTTDVLTLTRDGQQLLRAAEDGDQRYHRGLVQPRELHHDAHLYRLVRQEDERLAERGAPIERIQLDDELRGRWWSRELADLEPEERAELLGVGLDEQGHVLFPDAQLTVREADDSRSRCNIELVTSHYSGASIRAKAAAGFAMFRLEDGHARGGGRAHDRDLWERIISL